MLSFIKIDSIIQNYLQIPINFILVENLKVTMNFPYDEVLALCSFCLNHMIAIATYDVLGLEAHGGKAET